MLFLDADEEPAPFYMVDSMSISGTLDLCRTSVEVILSLSFIANILLSIVPMLALSNFFTLPLGVGHLLFSGYTHFFAFHYFIFISLRDQYFFQPDANSLLTSFSISFLGDIICPKASDKARICQ